MLALMLAALLGMMALAMDLGKAWNVSTELQHAADACALAGATQLDGGTDARIRAIRAATQAFVRNRQTFASDTVDADGDTVLDGPEVRFDTNEALDGANETLNNDIRFFEALADPLAVPPTLAIVAATDIDAHYIECTVQPRTVPFSFAAVVGAVDSVSPTARAMAFNGAAYCQVPPLFTCAPEDEFGQPISDLTTLIGKGVWLKGKDNPGGTDLFPGNFGLLCLRDEFGKALCSAQDISDALARVDPLAVCFSPLDNPTKPGEVTGPVQNGLNMRLGIYPQGKHKVPDGENPVGNNPQYGRSRNPVKGLIKGGSCKFNSWDRPDPQFEFPGPLDKNATIPGGYDYDYTTELTEISHMEFPRDNCAYDYMPMGDSSCRPGSGDGGRFGDTGEWDIETYMKVNHDIDDYTLLLGVNPDDLPCWRCDAVPQVFPVMPTRHEVFKWERDNPDNLAGTELTAQTLEDLPGALNCGIPPPATAERRLIPIAVADCSGDDSGKTDITILDVLVVFLTEAVGLGPEKDRRNIYGEVVDIVEFGQLSTIERNVIQLVE